MSALSTGVATSVGSLPHTDPAAAAEAVLSLHTDLPTLPELPGRHPAEEMVRRWLQWNGPTLDDDAHGGFLGFLAALSSLDDSSLDDSFLDDGSLDDSSLDDADAATPPAAVKAQVAGPLTLGMALVETGLSPAEAFARGAEVSARAATAVMDALDRALAHTDRVLFLDEPALVAWAGDEEGNVDTAEFPLEREHAVDLLSGVLAHVAHAGAVTGVHVCGAGDRRMAIEAGPDIVGFEVRPSVLDDGVALARYIDAGGWVAWGAVPTDRPVGDRADHWWNGLLSLWCDLTRAGCDPVRLRTQALITPACGLATHSEDQARRILGLCVEIGERVRGQTVATRLSAGA